MASPAPTYALASGMTERRATGPDGFKRMVGVSLLVHAALIVGVALTPSSWRTRQTDPREVMTISLGGAPGPRAGGLTSMSGRPVQQAVPPKPDEKPAPITPPAAKPPEMIEPTKAAPKQSPKPITPPQTTTDQGRARRRRPARASVKVRPRPIPASSATASGCRRAAAAPVGKSTSALLLPGIRGGDAPDHPP